MRMYAVQSSLLLFFVHIFQPSTFKNNTRWSWNFQNCTCVGLLGASAILNPPLIEIYCIEIRGFNTALWKNASNRSRCISTYGLAFVRRKQPLGECTTWENTNVLAVSDQFVKCAPTITYCHDFYKLPGPNL